MSELATKLLAVHYALDAADLPHAFGGAIALAYCTQEPRGTRDIDVNVFVDAGRAAEVLGAFPDDVAAGADDIASLGRVGQVRVWWGDTPVDVFLDVHEFHRNVADTVRPVPFAGDTIPVLGCEALTVFKIFFDRTKDWADVEAMVEAGAIDSATCIGWVVRLLGADDPRTRKLIALVGS